MLPAFSQTKERQEIDFLLYLEAKQRRLRDSMYNPEQLYATILRDLLQKSSELSLADKYEVRLIIFFKSTYQILNLEA